MRKTNESNSRVLVIDTSSTRGARPREGEVEAASVGAHEVACHLLAEAPICNVVDVEWSIPRNALVVNIEALIANFIRSCEYISDLHVVGIATGEGNALAHAILSCAVAILSDTHAEALNAAVRVVWMHVEGGWQTLVALRSCCPLLKKRHEPYNCVKYAFFTLQMQRPFASGIGLTAPTGSQSPLDVTVTIQSGVTRIRLTTLIASQVYAP